jgi:hypothetical protein
MTYSLVQNVGDSAVSAATNLLGVDPKLKSLGPKKAFLQVMNPDLKTSPVLNKGLNPDLLTTDERGQGFARMLGSAVDIGAVEAG